MIAGRFLTSLSSPVRSFVRAPDGSITTYDAPGAVHGTFAASINPAGSIAGWYTDAGHRSHGFVRSPEGVLTNVDIPGAISVAAASINPGGWVTGSYWDGATTRGFIFR